MNTSKTKAASRVNMINANARGRKYFSAWLKKHGIDINTLDEDKAYELIKNA